MAPIVELYKGDNIATNVSKLYKGDLVVFERGGSVLAATNLSILAINSLQNDLSWTNPNTSDVVFEIERSIEGENNFYLIGTTGINATEFTDYRILQGVSYDYRLRAKEGLNFSDYTSIVTSINHFNVVFTGLVNVTASGNSLTKVSGGTAWNAGAYGTVKAALNAFNELIWQVVGFGEGKMAALAVTNTNISFVDNLYAQSLGNNQSMQVYNSGVSAGLTVDIVLNDGDYFKILRDKDGTIKYGHSKDGKFWAYYHTEPSPDTSELFTEWLIFTQGGSIDNCRMLNEVNASTAPPPTNPFPVSARDELFHFDTVEELDVLRINVIDWMTKGKGLSNDLMTLVSSDIPNDAYNAPNRGSFTNLAQIDKYQSVLSTSTVFTNYIYHYVPTTKTNKSVLVMHGHADSWGLNGIDFVLLDLVQAGHDVFVMYMPGNAENTPDQGGGTLHDGYVSLESSTLNPMYAFVKQSIDCINWIEANLLSNTFIAMCGVSGGGWATTLTAAIETRIEKSFEFSGTLPMYLRDLDAASSGDYEQGHNGISSLVTHFYNDICSYFDLYSLCAQDREHRQIQNTNDTCCFRGIGYDNYEAMINGRVAVFGGFFDYISEAGAALHTVSSASRTILLNNI
jgi:hypothetical protein